MKRQRVPRGHVCLLCASLLLPSIPAHATDSINTEAHEAIAGIAGVSLALGVGIGLGIHHAMHRPIKGCVTTGPVGLQLTDQANNQAYQLIGTTTDVKPGEVVSLKGRKKSSNGSPATFDVDKVAKTYGSCSNSPNP